MTNELKQSDSVIVPVKSANKGTSVPAEPMEERTGTKGNLRSQSMHRTQGRARMSQAAERILGNAAWPARGVEAKQAHESPRRRCQRARRHPADRDARLKAVVLPQRLQGEIERCRRASRERPAPDR